MSLELLIIKTMIIKENNQRHFVNVESKKYRPAFLLNHWKGTERKDRLLVEKPFISPRERNELAKQLK